MARAEPGKKLSDGAGLYLFITPARCATWRVKYQLGGKEKLYSIGPYPLISLAAARVELLEVKAHLREGKDPGTTDLEGPAIALVDPFPSARLH